MAEKGPVTKLKEELQTAQAELEETKSILLRKAAEFDNARKRWQKDRQELCKLAQAEVLADFCEVWDNFERALAASADGPETSLESYRRGLELIFSQFRSTLEKWGMSQFSIQGSEFDPSRAEAVGHVENSDAEPGQVVEELKKGYMLGDKVLRPAQVIVAAQAREGKESKSGDLESDDSCL